MDESKLDESRVGQKQGWTKTGWTKTGWTKTGWTKMNWTKSGSTLSQNTRYYSAVMFEGFQGLPCCRETPVSRTAVRYILIVTCNFFFIQAVHECFVRSPHLQTQLQDGSVLPSLDPSLIFKFQLLPSPVHPTGFFFYICPGFLAIIILSSNINNN